MITQIKKKTDIDDFLEEFNSEFKYYFTFNDQNTLYNVKGYTEISKIGKNKYVSHFCGHLNNGNGSYYDELGKSYSKKEIINYIWKNRKTINKQIKKMNSLRSRIQ